jgi:hypothetical protein
VWDGHAPIRASRMNNLVNPLQKQKAFMDGFFLDGFKQNLQTLFLKSSVKNLLWTV